MNKKAVSTLSVALALALALALPLSAQAQQPGGPGQPMPQDQSRPQGQPPSRDGGHQQGQRPPQGQNHDNGNRHGQSARKPDNGRHHGVTVNDDHRHRAREWFDGHPGWSRPLPPDLHRGVVVGGRLPPGHYQRPPMVIVDMLPRPPAGHAYFAVGTDVVLAVIATGIIAQIVLNAP